MPFGTSGTLLLDPADLQIVNTTDNLSGGSFSGGIFSGATGTAIITWATVGGQLSGNNVILTTTGTGGAGNITVKNTSGVSLAGGGKNLTFLAHNEDDAAKVGDTVTIAESRPLSRRKRWVVTGVVLKAQTV